ncbi:hypothetical protein [Streptomyces sp. WAC06614]|uniref:hypothetical protein n=1 Tax=Streptomyces sp. WAC06614 TaxID=2487416 RepID=UPI000F777C80|nr:hypothetical protein [Streptomyces sp. WAC06614]RSS60475.1 hypothetical protein EF918_32945 [Streptomyces sp. WAC06614]
MGRWPRWIVVVVAGAAAAGCADVEGLRSKGDLGEVHAPQTLWPDHRPAPLPPDEATRGQATPVPGIPPRPGQSMRGADALAVLKADVTAATRLDGGTGRLVDPRTVQRLALCDDSSSGGPDCPVRPPVLHDLTDDGKEELITAVDVDDRVSELRVYTVRPDGTVARILSRRGVLTGVEVAADHLAVREPTSNDRLVAITDYVWNPRTSVMELTALTIDECPAGTASTTQCPPGGT